MTADPAACFGLVLPLGRDPCSVIVLPALLDLSRALLLGGVLFLLLVVRPLAWLLGDEAKRLGRGIAWMTICFGIVFALCVGAALLRHGRMGPQATALPDPRVVLAALAATLLIALSLALGRVSALLLLPLAAIVLTASLLAEYPFLVDAEIREEVLLLPIAATANLGAALWLGGLPALVVSLNRLRDGGWDIVAGRFNVFAVIGGALLATIVAVSGVIFWSLGFFFGSPDEAAGVIVDTMAVLFLALVLLGTANFVARRHTRRRPGRPPTRLRRFVEVEIGIAATLFLLTAAMSDLVVPAPPTWQQVAAYAVPAWPHLSNPLHPPPGMPEDTAAWAGIAVLAIGFLAMLRHAGLPAARHWPLLLLPLAALLFARADPAAWPLGPGRLIGAMSDAAARPQQVLALVLALLGLIEWWAGLRHRPRRGPALVLPLAVVLGASVLLAAAAATVTTEDMLTDQTRAVLGLLALAAGWARWLDVRLDPYEARWAGRVWPVCTMLCGALLFAYPLASAAV